MEVSFSKASYRNRIFAFAMDFFMLIITALFLMWGANSIVSNLSFYKDANTKINDFEMSSHLYVLRNNGNVQLMCDFYTVQEDADYEKYSKQFDEALIKFFSNEEIFPLNDGLMKYSELKLERSDLFIYEDQSHTNIVPKEGVTYVQLYNFYTETMANQAAKYVLSSDTYINNSKTIMYSFIFLELLIPIIISSLVFELIIPLILFRGKRTLGKTVFNLGVVDIRGLSCSWKRYVFRFLLLLFVEIILSIITVLIPLIVSFSMFVFSKTGQCFHDFVTNTYVIEAPSKSICVSEKEYKEKVEHTEGFELHKEDVVY